MQLGSRVARAGQAAAAEADGLHPEVAAVLLHEHVRGHLARAEEGVLGLVDGHRLVDARRIGVAGIDLPARGLLHEREAVGRVAVDLVGAREEEDRLRAVAPGGLQEVQGSVGVDGEVRVGLAGRPIVGRLRRRVDDHLDCLAHAGEQGVHPIQVADVQVLVPVVREGPLQAGASGSRGRLLPEEPGAHVVVHAHDAEPFGVKAPGGLGADQSGGAGHQGNAHACKIGLVPGGGRSIPWPFTGASPKSRESPGSTGGERSYPSGNAVRSRRCRTYWR